MLKFDTIESCLVAKCETKYYECSNGIYRMIVPFMPINAYAGYVDNYVDAVYVDNLEECEFYVRRIRSGRYFAFEIKGDSMDDGSKMSISNKDIVLARVLSFDLWENLHIEKYKRWIIIHKNTILCKQIVGQTDNGEIICHSLNPSPEYSDFSVSLKDVKQLLNIIKVERDEDNLF